MGRCVPRVRRLASDTAKEVDTAETMGSPVPDALEHPSPGHNLTSGTSLYSRPWPHEGFGSSTYIPEVLKTDFPGMRE